MQKNQHIRVRIAPSPTGLFHIGTARTALFNWLFAKKNKGSFIVRIEDTDTERSEQKYETDILDQMRWLGFDWDEGPGVGDYGPYRQSERGEIYGPYIRKLLIEKHAYYCFCSKEELEAERQSMLANGIPPKYSGKCRSINAADTQKNIAGGKRHVIRLKIPSEPVVFTDIIRGKITFDASLLGDIVIAKDESSPFYNLAAAIDDFEMKISHVIRAEDHLANTPKQILLQQALGIDSPLYAHLPLILNPDRSKMSKRFAATALSEYKKQGYLPEALINFMALLGWHPTGGQGVSEKEIFTREELIGLFELERVQKAGAAFNEEKLDWINGQYIKKLDGRQLLALLKEYSGLPKNLSREQLMKIIEFVKERMKKLSEFKDLTDLFFALPDYNAQILIWKQTPKEKISENLQEAVRILEKIPKEKFIKDGLPEFLNPVAEERGRGEFFWPLRAALSGQEASPGPFEIMDIIGKKETLKRIKLAVKKLKTAH